MTPYGDIRDIRHVVILMQENRGFDHYIGSLRGVRGFVTIDGDPAWSQRFTGHLETGSPSVSG